MVSLITIIDDDKVYQYITRKNIEASNYDKEILQLHDGQEALEYFTNHASQFEKLPEIILLDLNMPFLDGWQFLDELAKLNLVKKPTIYIVTSSVSSFDIEKAEAYSSVSGYHVKPVSKGKIAEILELYEKNNF